MAKISKPNRISELWKDFLATYNFLRNECGECKQAREEIDPFVLNLIPHGCARHLKDMVLYNQRVTDAIWEESRGRCKFSWPKDYAPVKKRAVAKIAPYKPPVLRPGHTCYVDGGVRDWQGRLRGGLLITKSCKACQEWKAKFKTPQTPAYIPRVFDDRFLDDHGKPKPYLVSLFKEYAA